MNWKNIDMNSRYERSRPVLDMYDMETLLLELQCNFKYEQLNVQYDGGMKVLNACPNRMDPITTHVIPEEIEKIEIVKGPFTVRFGQNFGGIINLVSKKPSSDNLGFHGSVEGGFETNGNNFVNGVSLFYVDNNV